MPHREQVPTAGSQVMEDGASALHLFRNPHETISAPHYGTRGKLSPRAMMEVPHNTSPAPQENSAVVNPLVFLL